MVNDPQTLLMSSPLLRTVVQAALKKTSRQLGQSQQVLKQFEQQHQCRWIYNNEGYLAGVTFNTPEDATMFRLKYE